MADLQTHPSCAFVFAPQLSRYELSASHPFKPVRAELTRSLLRACGLLTGAQEVAPEEISEALLLQVHAQDYVERVKAVSAGAGLEPEQKVRYGLGTPDNPTFSGMHAAIMQVCGATVSAMRLVCSGEVQRAVNFAGGLHHAARAKMHGFCTYNDLALALYEAVHSYHKRPLYIDLDVHHGDGVQDLFYTSQDVMTFSVHEMGRYLFPGTGSTRELGEGAGRGYSVNVPLELYTQDASYLTCLHAVLPRIFEVFKPDVVLLQAGADMHLYDPLAHQLLSNQGIAASYKLVCDLTDRYCNGRLVATGGGGYDPYRTVPRLWSMLWCLMSGQDVPEYLPESWRAETSARYETNIPATFSDDLASWPEVAASRQDNIAAMNRFTVRKLLKNLEATWREVGLVNGP